MLNPIVKERRAQTGEWYATPLLQFTLRSVKLMLRVLSGNQKLHLGPEGEAGLDISIPELKTIESELEKLLATTPRAIR